MKDNIHLMLRNANHIIPLCCHLPVSFRSLVDWCGFPVSYKLQIFILQIVVVVFVSIAFDTVIYFYER